MGNGMNPHVLQCAHCMIATCISYFISISNSHNPASDTRRAHAQVEARARRIGARRWRARRRLDCSVRVRKRAPIAQVSHTARPAALCY